LVDVLGDFESHLRDDELQAKVLALIPSFHALRDLGCSLVDPEVAGSARDRILQYLLTYPRVPIDGDELMVVSGIGEWARRVRELRVQYGWRIISGVTHREMLDADADPSSMVKQLPRLAFSQYMLMNEVQDQESADRWVVAHRIRNSKESVRDKLIEFFQENVGAEVTGEELRYAAGDKTEWARRTRELRTEFGWPIVTQATGRPDLGVGVYLLEADRQAPEHDRNIPDAVRRKVLQRDNYACTNCGWRHEMWNRSDPRHLEAHHVKAHKDRGSNEADNLVTLCTVCHDEVHAR
jgi:hypothetical protein